MAPVVGADTTTGGVLLHAVAAIDRVDPTDFRRLGNQVAALTQAVKRRRRLIRFDNGYIGTATVVEPGRGNRRDQRLIIDQRTGHDLD